MQALRYLPAAAVVALLVSGTAHAVPAAPPGTGGSETNVISVRSATTDVSRAHRRHYRYVRNRWRVVRPYASYGVYGPRPFHYAPYPFYLPFPFGFGVGFDPYYW